MTAEVQASGAQLPSSPIAAGTVLSDRFELIEPTAQNPLFDIYRASDRNGGAGAFVYVFHTQALEQPPKVEHKNVAAVLGSGEFEGRSYIAYELHEGNSLRELLERRKKTGSGAFNPKGAINILTHAAAGIEALHEHGVHGLVSPDNVFINKAGRVVIYGAGLGAYVAGAQGAVPDWPSVSPEVKSGEAPTKASDVYSLSAIGYQALVGAAPIKGCKRPSEAVPGIGREVDTVVGQGMHPDPSQRHASAKDVARAFREAVITSRQSAALEAQRSSQQLAAQAAPRPSLAHEIVTAPESTEDSGTFQLSPQLSAALADKEERFLVNKGNLDYGPFSLEQVVKMIQSGEIQTGHIVIDKDTGRRTNVEDDPLLSDLVHQAAQRRDEERRAAAEVAHASSERRRGFALYAFIAAGVLALSGGAYLVVSKLAADKSGDEAATVAGLEQGSLQVKITPIRRIKGKKRGKRSGGKAGGKSASGVSGGWDDSLDLDMNEGGGSERLDDSQINPVIQKHGGSLGRCLSSTKSRYADIDFIIKGSGKVSQVRVNGQTSGALSNCVRGAMMKMKFPSFNGPRTKANFNMSL